MQVSNAVCVICSTKFNKKAWNSTVCSDKCRSMKNKKRKDLWYQDNKESENIKARESARNYTKEQRADSYSKRRDRLGLSRLQNLKCTICNQEFKQKIHNSKTCSTKCSKKMRKLTIKKYDYYNNNINHKIAVLLRNRLNKALKRKTKSGSAVNNLGCSIEFLKTYLESKFTEGMTWENQGKWHIDHIKPLCSFNLENKEELLKACHYTNLQPLWAKDNLRKGSKIES